MVLFTFCSVVCSLHGWVRPRPISVAKKRSPPVQTLAPTAENPGVTGFTVLSHSPESPVRPLRAAAAQ